MKIQYLKRDEIKEEKWDACIASATSTAALYGYTWWLDIACPDWEGLVMDDYCFVMPLPVKKKYGFSYLVQPPFTQYFSIYGKAEVSNERANAFMGAIPKCFRRIHIRLKLPISPSSNKGEYLIFQPTHYVPLNFSYEEIQANYTANIKKNRAKYEKENLSLQTTTSISEIMQFKRIELSDKVKVPEGNYLMLEALLNQAAQHFFVQAYSIVKPDGTKIGGSVVIDTPSRVYTFSGYLPEARKLRATYFFIDQILQKFAKVSQEKCFDFCGSALEGVRSFNLSFGAKEEEIAYWEYDKFPFTIFQKLGH